jgi:hypothetical protein
MGLLMRRVLLLIVVLVLAACGDGSGVTLGDADLPQNEPSADADASDAAGDLAGAASEATDTPTTTIVSGDTTGTTVETSIPDEDDVIDPPEPTKPSPPETVPDTTIPVVTGEVPADLMDQILADAGSRIAAEAAFTVVRAQAVTWSDGSLGCPEPGMSYTQALVEGYWVVLDAGGKTLDYRASASGAFKLCPDSLGVPPVGGGDM